MITFMYIFLGIIGAILILSILYIVRREGYQVWFGYGVPYVQTPDHKIEILLKNISLTSGDRFLELGCGDGKVVASIKEKFREVDCYGIEASPYPYHLAKKRKKENRREYTLIKSDFFKESFEKYDVIYCYLIPYLMPKVWKKITDECKKGTLLYSSAFAIKGVTPEKKIEIKKDVYIYVYKV